MVNGCIERLAARSVCGMLPFTGFEECFEKDSEDISPTIRFHGSLENTVRYLDALLDFRRHAENKERAEAEIRIVKKAIINNFAGPDGFYLNAPVRESNIKHPHAIYGCCDICYIKKTERWSLESQLGTGWLERTVRGFYSCPDCLSEKPLSKHIEKSALYIKDIKPLLLLYYADDELSDTLKLNEYLAKQLSENSRLSFPERGLALGFLYDHSVALYEKELSLLYNEIRTTELSLNELAYLIRGSSVSAKRHKKPI